MIVSPHPRTPGSSNLTVEHIRKALRKVGAPEDLALCIREPSHDKTRELMEHCDFAVATGGAALVKVVYEAATPCHTVGAGNVVSIIDETADLRATAEKIVKSKCANNSASCSSENAVAVEESVYDRMIGEPRGGRRLSLLDGRAREAPQLLLARRRAPEPGAGGEVRYLDCREGGTRCPGGHPLPDGRGREDRTPRTASRGRRSPPTLTLWRWNDFSEMCARLNRILDFSGAGHSASLHSERDERRVELAHAGQRGAPQLQHAARGGQQRELVQRAADDRHPGMRELGRQHDQRQHRLASLPQLHVAVDCRSPEHIPADEELFGDYLAAYGND